MKLVTAEEMRRIDSTAIGKFGISGLVLMENAGRQVADAVLEMVQGKPSARVVVVCGKGNNGGDGFVVARHLLNQGVDVHVVLLVEPAALQGDAAINYRVARNIGVSMDEQARLLHPPGDVGHYLPGYVLRPEVLVGGARAETDWFWPG